MTFQMAVVAWAIGRPWGNPQTKGDQGGDKN